MREEKGEGEREMTQYLHYTVSMCVSVNIINSYSPSAEERITDLDF